MDRKERNYDNNAVYEENQQSMKGKVKHMKKGWSRVFTKGLGCMALATVMAATGIPASGINVLEGNVNISTTVKLAEAASVTSNVPIACYPIAANNFRTYDSIGGSAAGWIYPTDRCTIHSVHNDNGTSWVYVSYPTAKGTRYKYCLGSNFFADTNFSTNTVNSGIARTVYTKSDLSTKLGTVYASDYVTITGNSGNSQQILYKLSGGGYKMGWIKGSISTGSNPEGWLDSVTSTSDGTISVRGWAFDRDNLSAALEMHVYVGGPAGSGAPAYVITANQCRPDVNSAYNGIGNYHGYESTISVSKTGKQKVYVYAINTGGGNSNPLIGTKTVNILGASKNTGNVANGNYIITSALNNSYALDVNNNSSANGANIQLYTKSDNNKAQIFNIEAVGKSYYKIVNAANGKALDVAGGVATAGVNVQQYEYNSSNAQLWCFEDAGNGYYYIRNKLGYYLDVYSGAAKNHQNIWVYSKNQTLAQKFKLNSCSDTLNVNLSVPSYKQYNYPNTYIGTKTIKQIGCTVTSLAMKYSYHTGTTTTPDKMKAMLTFDNNSVYWSSVGALGYTVTGKYSCRITNSMMSTIYQQLKAGKPVVIGGEKSNGGTHWVVITGYTGSSSTSFSSSDFKIQDPNSTVRTNLQQFLNTYPTVLRMVY